MPRGLTLTEAGATELGGDGMSASCTLPTRVLITRKDRFSSRCFRALRQNRIVDNQRAILWPELFRLGYALQGPQPLIVTAMHQGLVAGGPVEVVTSIKRVLAE
jgi:hypothetical protein